ncbi:hypothetical protein DSO57_1000201, partial [Entomophthora muscae]
MYHNACSHQTDSQSLHHINHGAYLISDTLNLETNFRHYDITPSIYDRAYIAKKLTMMSYRLKLVPRVTGIGNKVGTSIIADSPCVSKKYNAKLFVTLKQGCVVPPPDKTRILSEVSENME